MWPKTFDDRLKSWNQLRNQVQFLSLEETLETINKWWFQTPWTPYYLHWDDQPRWPDPWQLLSDNVYCPVAKGLGILYTISMLDRADMIDAELILTDLGHNLVSVAQGKYILNWNPEIIVNTNQEQKIIKRLTQYQVAEQYN
jgi:hypothetical protein